MKPITIKRFGNWAQARRATSTLDKSIKRAIRSAEEKIARRLIKIVKGHILSQDLPWVPLSPTTKNRKGHDNVYLDSRFYINSIKFWQKNYVIHIGIPRGVMDADGEVELWKVATWMEKGLPNRGMPPRPLWGPSIKELGGGPQGMANLVKESINRKLRREGWDITQF